MTFSLMVLLDHEKMQIFNQFLQWFISQKWKMNLGFLLYREDKVIY